MADTDLHVVKGYKRDPITQIVINSDEKEYKDYKFKMEIFKEMNELKEQIVYLNKRIENLEEKI